MAVEESATASLKYAARSRDMKKNLGCAVVAKTVLELRGIDTSDDGIFKYCHFALACGFVHAEVCAGLSLLRPSTEGTEDGSGCD